MSESNHRKLLEDAEQIILPIDSGTYALLPGDLVYAKDTPVPKARAQSARVHIQSMNGTGSLLSEGYTEIRPNQIYRFTNLAEPGAPAHVQLSGAFLLRPHS